MLHAIFRVYWLFGGNFMLRTSECMYVKKFDTAKWYLDEIDIGIGINSP